MTVARTMEFFFEELLLGVREDFDPKKGNPIRVVNHDESKDVLMAYLPTFEGYANQYTEWLMKGEIDVEDWGRYLQDELVKLYLTSAAAAVGHAGLLTNADIALVEDKMKDQMKYLKRFTAMLDRMNVEEYSRDYIIKRILMYNGAGVSVLEEMRDRSIQRPVLPFYPRDGTTHCMAFCQCEWDWQDLDPEVGDYNIWWLMGTAEHCSTCLERALACYPLEVRKGEIVTNLNLRRLTAHH